MLGQFAENLGEILDRVPADPGYFSEANVKSFLDGFTEHIVPRDGSKHSDGPQHSPRNPIPHDRSAVDRMLHKTPDENAES